MNVNEALTIAKTRVHACFLCNAPHIQYIGLFMPRDPARWGTPDLLIGQPPPKPGKARGFWYGVCASCMRAGDVPARAEDRLADMCGGMN